MEQGLVLLVDTTELIDFLRGRAKPHAMLNQALLAGYDLCTSVVSVSEVFAGLRVYERPGAMALLGSLRWIAVDGAVAMLAGELRHQYSHRGVTLALADMLIAATAILSGAHLATANRKHFPMPEIRFYEAE